MWISTSYAICISFKNMRLSWIAYNVLVSNSNFSLPYILVAPPDRSMGVLYLLAAVADSSRLSLIPYQIVRRHRDDGKGNGKSYAPSSHCPMFFDILLSPMCILGHRTSRPRLTYYVCWAPSVLHGSVGPGKQAQSLTPACIPYWPLCMFTRPPKITVYHIRCYATNWRGFRGMETMGKRSGQSYTLFPLRCFLTLFGILHD